MKMKLYNLKSTKNTINKVLEDETEYTIKIKNENSITNPVIMLQSTDLILFNYAYIPTLERYYFVDKIELFPNNIYYINLSCDVLESFKDDILSAYAVITRQTEINTYYNADYVSEARKESDIYKSDVTLDLNTKETILVTIGGD